ncbi:MAG: patatin-like phospholipase family protein [Alphaproteobacteria bacterium]
MSHDWTSIEVGVVLQGGGALGAYEWGAIEALFDLMDELEETVPVALKVVTGVSIGAINGACVVGVKGADGKERRKSGRAQLAAFWNDLQLETPFRGRFELPFGLPSFAPARDISLLGLPGFYTPRPDVWNFPKWTSLYDTTPLKGTLDKHIVFPEIDASETGFIVSAVDVEGGTLKRFRNAAGRQQRVQRPEEDDVVVPFMPEHIMASGSLAPQFPWTKIKERLYWDGGIVDNTPLGDAMEIFSESEQVYRLLVVMNLYPLTGRKPENLLGVADRVHELSYGNRMRQDSASAKRINDLLRLIRDLERAATGGGVTLDPGLAQRVKDVRGYKIANTVQIDLQTPGKGQARLDDEAGLRDFSPDTIAERRRRGHERAMKKLNEALAKDRAKLALRAVAPATTGH